MSIHPKPATTFSAFAQRWRPDLLAYAREVLGESDLIEDVAQTVLLKVLTAGGWDEIESPKAYCRRAAYREALRELESQRRSVPLPAVEPHARSTAPGPWEIVVRREGRARLEACLRRLPRQCAAVMTLKLMEGLTRHEIASRLRIGLGGVEKQVTRGNRLLR